LDGVFSNPLPWLTFQAVDFLEENVKSDFNIFEWGSGGSTLWFQKKGCSIHAYEHDEQWLQFVSSKITGNNKVFLKPLGDEYLNPPEEFKNYDIIIIDGRKRVECASRVIEAAKKGNIKEGCMVIYDDSNRREYSEALQELSKYSKHTIPCSETCGVMIDKLTTIFIF
jgi:hypothetical protein